MIGYASNTDHFTHTLGVRQYELSNHLGNVLAVISDRKYARDIDNTGEIDYYEPDVLVTYDYSPFGVILKGRNFEKQICVEDEAIVLENQFNGTSTDGWIKNNPSAGSGYNTTNVSQTLKVRVKTTGGASNTNNGAYKLVTLTDANRPHTLSFDFSRTATPPFNNTVEVRLVNTTNPLDVLILTTLSTNGTYTYTFTPTDCENTEYKLSFTVLGTVAGNRDFFLDNIIITANVCNYVDFGTYRYGFNGMEKDDEVKGSGNSYDFGARMYDSGLGRWLSIDHLTHKYPFISPYVFVANMPIIAIDPDGNDIIVKNTTTSYDGPAPKKIGDIATTQSSFSFEFNQTTKEFDLIVTNHIQYSKYFKSKGANGKTLEEENPGLTAFAKKHEGVHVLRNIKAAKKSFTYSTTLLEGGEKKLTGTADKIMTQFYNTYINERNVLREAMINDKITEINQKYNVLINAPGVTNEQVAQLQKDAQNEFDTWAASEVKAFDTETNDNIQKVGVDLIKKVSDFQASLNKHEGTDGVNAETSKGLPDGSKSKGIQDGTVKITWQGTELK